MNKTVLITGASRGVGASCARVFASKGYNIIINYNNSMDEALKLKEELENTYKVRAIIIKCDISIENEVIDMVDKSIEVFGKIDVLVNNAGIAIDKDFDDKNVSDFKRTLDVNLIGTFLVSKYVGKHMLKNRYGNIINVSSTNGIDTYYKESLDYDASKAGVISLTNNLANAYAPYIRVNCVAPGWINTDMNKELDNEFIKVEEDKILLKRFAEPVEIANVIYFLASDSASYINSSVIKIDGGRYV